MRCIALLLALALPLGAGATPTTEAVDVYVKCLESEYDAAKDSTDVALSAEDAAFNRCSDARTRLLASTSEEEAKRLVAEIDAAARTGMSSAP